MSAISESMHACGSRRVAGACQTRSPARSAAARTCAIHDVVGAHQPRDLVAERDDTRAGERGEVDDRVGLVLGRERQRVGEDQPAFGVGVQDLDRLAVAHREHVARAGSRCRSACSRRAARSRCTRVFTPRSRSADIAAMTAAPPDMSVFIVSMPRRGLDRQPARVEHDALADERERGPRVRRARTSSLQESRRTLGTFADSDHAAHACLLQLVAREHLHLQPGRGRELLRLRRRSRRATSPAAGSLTRSRAQTTASRDARATVDRRRACRVRAPDDAARESSFEGFASHLYRRNW